MTTAPVSAIVPAWNAEGFLREAIVSIRGQDPKPAEVIVVDDGSIDRTADVASSFGDVTCIPLGNNHGPAAARNRGIAQARQPLLAFLDADDLWPEGRLRLLLDALERDPAAAVAMGRVLGCSFPVAGGRRVFTEPAVVAPVFGCALFRREVFDTVGLLDERFRTSEDQDFFLRMREGRIQIAVLDKVTLWYCHRPGSVTYGTNWWNHDTFLVLKNSVARRRALGRVENLPSLEESGKGKPVPKEGEPLEGRNS